jgi:hypothetical protein
MPQCIKTMKRKRHREQELRCDLREQWPGCKRRSHRRGCQIEAQHWCNEVGDSKNVEGSRKHDPGDAGETRGVPGYLRAIDAQVGSNWAEFALCDEDLLRIRGGELLGCDGSVEVLVWQLYTNREVLRLAAVVEDDDDGNLEVEGGDWSWAMMYLVWTLLVSASGATKLDAGLVRMTISFNVSANSSRPCHPS